jgi:hypothetical protein
VLSVRDLGEDGLRRRRLAAPGDAHRRADARRVAIDHAEAVVVGELDNPLVHLGVIGESGSPGIGSVSLKVYVGSNEPEEHLRRIWQETLERSPLARTLAAAAVRLDIRLTIT